MRELEPPKVLVSIDPGVTTGIARFENGELEFTVASRHPHEDLREQLLDMDPDYIVVERGPTQRRQPEACVLVEQLVIELYGKSINWIRPSEWKGHPKSRLSDRERHKTGTIHEHDAASMGKRSFALDLKPAELEEEWA